MEEALSARGVGHEGSGPLDEPVPRCSKTRQWKCLMSSRCRNIKELMVLPRPTRTRTLGL